MPVNAVEEAELLPPVSRYSPERNVVDSLRLIRAEGPIQETLACFQMLAQLMKLPFRRDSIEKVLQDNLRRGLTPNLQLVRPVGGQSWVARDGGQGACRGGHASAGAIDASLAGRLCPGGGQQ